MTITEVRAAYGSTIEALANIIGVPPAAGSVSNYVNIVSGIIEQESGGNPDAIGDNGCSLGLMQLNTCAGWPQQYGYTNDNLFDPAININYGCQYLNSLLNQYYNIDQAISAYNAGHPTSINQDYVASILNYMKQLGAYVLSNPILIAAAIGGGVLIFWYFPKERKSR